MSLASEIQAIAAKVQPYEAFVLLATRAIGGPTEALADVLAAGLNAIADHEAGTLTAEQATGLISGLLSGEAADDAAADAVVAARRGQTP
ncbi:MAG: hypothetical protein V4479_07620 [Actinomycetota bacterium]